MTRRRTFPAVLLAMLLVGLVFGPAGSRPDSPASGQHFDVRSYRFTLTLFQHSDRLSGRADVAVRAHSDSLTAIVLDLVGPRSLMDWKGMEVSRVRSGTADLAYAHRSNRLEIALPRPLAAGNSMTIHIDYEGRPRDGLLFERNLYGNPTIFGDNWPERARHWLPCVDHPADKATVEFVVSVPESLRVVANGALLEEALVAGGRRLVRWATRAPISSKVAVFGAGRFAVERDTTAGGIPIENWVYPENRQAGFVALRPAGEILDTFAGLFGPYPYAKLANVQARTRFGGMENASVIFYNEKVFVEGADLESLLAHEIAHQWFGDSVTEADWPHVWLSEGFATYAELVYRERRHGVEPFRSGLAEARSTVIEFDRRVRSNPVLDRETKDPMALLTPNAYQKGAWFLHQLRHRIGEDAFFETLQSYYRAFRDSVATTDDFRRMAEAQSGQDLAGFFHQWLERPGFPRLEVTWRFHPPSKTVDGQVRQVQADAPFTFPLELGLVDSAGAPPRVVRLDVRERRTPFRIAALQPPAEIVLDPNVVLLFEGGVVE